MDIRRRCCNSTDMFRGIYLSLDLELALQPVAAVLGVPQGLRNGPQLSRNSSFLLRDLLQLGGGRRGGGGVIQRANYQQGLKSETLNYVAKLVSN